MEGYLSRKLVTAAGIGGAKTLDPQSTMAEPHPHPLAHANEGLLLDIAIRRFPACYSCMSGWMPTSAVTHE